MIDAGYKAIAKPAGLDLFPNYPMLKKEVLQRFDCPLGDPGLKIKKELPVQKGVFSQPG